MAEKVNGLGLFYDQLGVGFETASPTRLQDNVYLLKNIKSNSPKITTQTLTDLGPVGYEAGQIGRIESDEEDPNEQFSCYLVPSEMTTEEVRRQGKAEVLVVRNEDRPLEELGEVDIALASAPFDTIARMYPAEGVVIQNNLTGIESVNEYFREGIIQLNTNPNGEINDHSTRLNTIRDLEGLWIDLAREGRLEDLEGVMRGYFGPMALGNDIPDVYGFVVGAGWETMSPLAENWVSYSAARALGEVNDFSENNMLYFMTTTELLVERFNHRNVEVYALTLYPIYKLLKERNPNGIDEITELIKTMRGKKFSEAVARIWAEKFREVDFNRE